VIRWNFKRWSFKNEAKWMLALNLALPFLALAAAVITWLSRL
jgi:hypothetical protein